MKKTFLCKGEIIDYQTVIEDVVGPFLAGMRCYDANWDKKSEINGESIERDRAYFVPDSDYEIIIRKKLPVRK